MLPLITEKNIALTHLIVCSFHINVGAEVHLNDYPPGDARFNTLWAETQTLRDSGVVVMGMVGGAAGGSFDPTTLDSTDTVIFELYYGQLRQVIVDYGLQGMDLDVEQDMSQYGITRLVQRLYEDFGPEFAITLAPVASALHNGGNLSGFDYEDLEAFEGPSVAFYNAQFYNGWGSLETTSTYDAVVANGWSPSMILAGQTTSPENGSGFISTPDLNTTILQLRQEYGEIGGIMGWEYFNSQPGGEDAPWLWAQEMTEILRPNEAVGLTITEEKANVLEAAWKTSIVKSRDENAVFSQVTKDFKPTVDYMAMVNV